MEALKPLIQYLGLSALLLGSGSVNAGWATPLVDNWLVGGYVGYGHRQATFQSSIYYESNPPLFPTRDAREISDTGVIAGMLLGYQAISNRCLAGIEVNLEAQPVDSQHGFAFRDDLGEFGWVGNLRYQTSLTLAVSARLGYAIATYFMPYVRLGVEFDQDDFRTSFDNTLIGNITISETHWTHRFLLGFGAEVPIPNTCGITMRLEYNYHSKGRTIEPHGVIIDHLISPSLTSAMQPYMKSIRLAVVWNIFPAQTRN